MLKENVQFVQIAVKNSGKTSYNSITKSESQKVTQIKGILGQKASYHSTVSKPEQLKNKALSCLSCSFETYWSLFMLLLEHPDSKV